MSCVNDCTVKSFQTEKESQEKAVLASKAQHRSAAYMYIHYTSIFYCNTFHTQGGEGTRRQSCVQPTESLSVVSMLPLTSKIKVRGSPKRKNFQPQKHIPKNAVSIYTEFACMYTCTCTLFTDRLQRLHTFCPSALFMSEVQRIQKLYPQLSVSLHTDTEAQWATITGTISTIVPLPGRPVANPRMLKRFPFGQTNNK